MQTWKELIILHWSPLSTSGCMHTVHHGYVDAHDYCGYVVSHDMIKSVPVHNKICMIMLKQIINQPCFSNFFHTTICFINATNSVVVTNKFVIVNKTKL